MIFTKEAAQVLVYVVIATALLLAIFGSTTEVLYHEKSDAHDSLASDFDRVRSLPIRGGR